MKTKLLIYQFPVLASEVEADLDDYLKENWQIISMTGLKDNLYILLIRYDYIQPEELMHNTVYQTLLYGEN